MNDPQKHHFLPVFYLKNWCGDDKKLTQFSIPFGDAVKSRRVHPQGTGYIAKLYAVEGLSGEISQDVEKIFLSPVDSRAAEAMKELLSSGDATKQNRVAWSKFVFTLIMRMPTEIALLKQVIRKLEADLGNSVLDMLLRHVPDVVRAEAEEAIQELRSSILNRCVKRTLSMMSLDDFSDRFAEMNWKMINFDNCAVELMTSDRPVSITRNEHTAGSTVFALPIGPRDLFVCSDNGSLIDRLEAIDQQDMAIAVNIDIISNARTYSYASSDRETDFVRQFFGRNKNPSPIEQVLQNSMLEMDEFKKTIASFTDDELRSHLSEAAALAKHQSEHGAE